MRVCQPVVQLRDSAPQAIPLLVVIVKSRYAAPPVRMRLTIIGHTLLLQGGRAMFSLCSTWFGLSFVHPHPEFRTGIRPPALKRGVFFAHAGKVYLRCLPNEPVFFTAPAPIKPLKNI